LALAAALSALAEEPQAERGKEKSDLQFLRLTRDADKRPLALEAAIVHYVPADCSRDTPTVDLIAAVHVADKSFYEELNRSFAKYDAVLYELVAPEGTKVPKGGQGAGNNPVSMLQKGMTGLLDLQFQLEGVDYTKDNMVHADLSPEEFSESMRKRGESMMETFFRMMGYAMARQNQGSGGSGDLQMLMALFDKNRAMILKRMMAEQFEDLGGSLAAIEGPQGSTLIGQRNKRAMEVLRKQIDAGKKSLAIFYGAGHLPDFDRRLRDELALTALSTRWVVAWDLRDKAQSQPGDAAAPAIEAPAKGP